MTWNAFDRPPAGFVRSGKGWLIPQSNPKIRKVELENIALKSAMAALEERLAKLEQANE